MFITKAQIDMPTSPLALPDFSSRWWRVLGRRSLHAVPTVLAILLLGFVLLKLAPGDPAIAMAAEAGAATSETMAQLRAQFGLDRPLWQQFTGYLYGLAHLDLGMSPRYHLPVMDLIAARLPSTLVLMSGALALALALGLGAGLFMASYARRLPDRITAVIVLVFYSVPEFWIGLMLIVLFSIQWQLFPSGGFGTIASGLEGWELWLDLARYAVLPVVSLALFYIAIYSRIARSSVLDVQSRDFVRTARAKGLSPARVTLRHVVRNALIPVTALAGMHIAGILGGSVVIETVFAWPGLGRLAVDAVLARDFKLLAGILLFSAILVVLVNILVDLLQAVLDPRVEH